MDEMTQRSLHEQEQALRAVMAAFSEAVQRVNKLGADVGWVGPARAAYDVAAYTLQAEVRVAEDHLAGALAGTVNALGAGTTGRGCG